MGTLSITLPAQQVQTAFNLRRWEELLADAELAKIEGRTLYFDAGAHEVWLCDASGALKFLTSATDEPLEQSRLCPPFPRRIELR